jgi:hypothetical protein
MDASALAKRYVPEKGVAQVNAILDTVPAERICVLNVGMGEVMSILVRKRNSGAITAAEFTQAAAEFKAEIVRARHLTNLSVTSRLIIASFPLIVAHSLNSTAAIILKSALAIARKLRVGGDDLVLVASDHRLLRAAKAEGLATFDPETQDQAALSALLGP